MFSSQPSRVILLGDSILNNSLYVPENKSIQFTLKSVFLNDFHSFAQDGATINDIYGQLDKLRDSKSLVIFLSAGGNNIINNMKYINTNTNNDGGADNHIDKIYNNYVNLVQSINIKLPNAKLILFNLYYPTAYQYQSFKPLINKWNTYLDQLFDNNNVQIHEIIRVDQLLTNNSDFTSNIEPSSIGGQKICDAIIETMDRF